MANASKMVVIKVFGKLPRLRFDLCAAIDMATDFIRIAPQADAKYSSAKAFQASFLMSGPDEPSGNCTQQPKKRYRDIHIELGRFHICGSCCNGRAKNNYNEPLSK